MLKVNYYLGLNDKDLKKQVIDTDSAQVVIARVLSTYGYQGATLYDATGLWLGERENTIVIELVLEKFQANHDTLKEIAVILRKCFNQDAVMMTTTKLETVDFV